MKKLILLPIIIIWFNSFSQGIFVPDSTLRIIADSLNIIPDLRENMAIQSEIIDSQKAIIKTDSLIIENRNEQIKNDSANIESWRVRYNLMNDKVTVKDEEINYYKKSLRKQKWSKWLTLGVGILVGSAGTILIYEFKD